MSKKIYRVVLDEDEGVVVHVQSKAESEALISWFGEQTGAYERGGYSKGLSEGDASGYKRGKQSGIIIALIIAALIFGVGGYYLGRDKGFAEGEKNGISIGYAQGAEQARSDYLCIESGQFAKGNGCPVLPRPR